MTIAERDVEVEARRRRVEAIEAVPESAPELVAALYDENVRVRQAAAEQLARVEPTPEVLSAVLHVLSSTGDVGARNAAAKTLGLIGSAAVAPLAQLLKTGSDDVRRFAAEVLGEIAYGDSAAVLIEALSDVDLNVRVSAAEALGRIGGIAASRALNELLAAPEPILQVCALESLAALDAPVALPRLVPLLNAVPSRRSAYRLLGQLRHPAAFGLICRGLSSVGRDAALLGLGAWRDGLGSEAEEALKHSQGLVADSVEWLKRSLLQDDRQVRLGALRLTVALNEPALAPALAQASHGGDLGEVVLHALMRLGPGGVSALLKGTPAPIIELEDEARAVACEAVLRSADPSVVSLLERLMREGDRELSDLAARALGRTLSLEALAPLAEALDIDELSSAAARGLRVLGATFPSEVAAVLEVGLQKAVRPHALRAYATVWRDKAGKRIREAAKHSDPRVRAAAVESAEFMGSVGLSELLSAALVDESAHVRRSAARALGKVPGAVAVPLLKRALDDSEAAVQAAAAWSVALQGASEYRPELEQVAAAPSGPVALAALQALFSLDGLDDRTLAAATSHSDPEVVKLALAYGADSVAGVKRALSALTHSRWDVRVAAARVLAVSAEREALVALHRALEAETDDLAREVLMAAATVLTKR
ncbi:MAG: HEAT repeat domain-containing protein [Myxococcaceae bacterium]|nr:HEAT repeat domain-containing protein [Myxococcaceae bacterium]